MVQKADKGLDEEEADNDSAKNRVRASEKLFRQLAS
jgi:hypothetical protein